MRNHRLILALILLLPNIALASAWIKPKGHGITIESLLVDSTHNSLYEFCIEEKCTDVPNTIQKVGLTTYKEKGITDSLNLVYNLHVINNTLSYKTPGFTEDKKEPKTFFENYERIGVDIGLVKQVGDILTVGVSVNPGELIVSNLTGECVYDHYKTNYGMAVAKGWNVGSSSYAELEGKAKFFPQNSAVQIDLGIKFGTKISEKISFTAAIFQKFNHQQSEAVFASLIGAEIEDEIRFLKIFEIQKNKNVTQIQLGVSGNIKKNIDIGIKGIIASKNKTLMLELIRAF